MKQINEIIKSMNLSPKQREAKRFELAEIEVKKFRADRKAGKLSKEEIQEFENRLGLWHYNNPRNNAHFNFYSNNSMNQMVKMISGKHPSQI